MGTRGSGLVAQMVYKMSYSLKYHDVISLQTTDFAKFHLQCAMRILLINYFMDRRKYLEDPPILVWNTWFRKCSRHSVGSCITYPSWSVDGCEIFRSPVDRWAQHPSISIYLWGFNHPCGGGFATIHTLTCETPWDPQPLKPANSGLAPSSWEAVGENDAGELVIMDVSQNGARPQIKLVLGKGLCMKFSPSSDLFHPPFRESTISAIFDVDLPTKLDVFSMSMSTIRKWQIECSIILVESLPRIEE